jgi:hypothetical protein
MTVTLYGCVQELRGLNLYLVTSCSDFDFVSIFLSAQVNAGKVH